MLRLVPPWADARLLRPCVVQQTLRSYFAENQLSNGGKSYYLAPTATPTGLRVGRGQRPNVSSSSDVVAVGRYTTDG